MAPKPILYEMDIQPGTRSVRMVAHLIGLELEHKPTDLFAGEHLTESFLKMNPLHTIPTLDDDGKYVWESSVICTYLIDKYADSDDLYPKDQYQRAICNQRLHFTNAIVFQRMRNCSMIIYTGGVEVPKEFIDAIFESYDMFEKLLGDNEYLAGSHLTVADLCAIPLISSADEIYAPIDAEKFSRLSAWLGRMKELPFYEDMEARYVASYKAAVEGFKAKNIEAKESSN